MNTQTKEFGDISNGMAAVMIKKIKNNRVAVVRYLPAGMDICPEVYGRFTSIEAAQSTFERACQDVIAMGFPEIRETL